MGIFCLSLFYSVIFTNAEIELWWTHILSNYLLADNDNWERSFFFFRAIVLEKSNNKNYENYHKTILAHSLYKFI